MNGDVLVTNNLNKIYGKFKALDNVSITVKKGDIYGLIGRNGAGKTTLLRIIAGQSESSSGDMALLGKEKNINATRKYIGSMVENPGFLPYLTVYENLEYYRIAKGIPKTAGYIDDLINAIGLSEAKKKKFKNLSLGMKQRLGIGLALMGNPELLLLDEPVNGLDPMGIVEIRNILLKLNKEKKMTIIISSHILSELSNLATTYGFIDKGKMVEEISAKDLEEKCKACLEIKVDDAEKTAVLLEKKLHCTNYEILPHNVIHVYDYVNDPSVISEAVIEEHIKLLNMEVKGQTLEEYYISLLGGKENA